jgi:hypothetical protein
MHCRDAVVWKEGLRRDYRRVPLRRSVDRKIGEVVLCRNVRWWWFALHLLHDLDSALLG